jgi:receptor protein-tyrosine kinase
MSTIERAAAGLTGSRKASAVERAAERLEQARTASPTPAEAEDAPLRDYGTPTRDDNDAGSDKSAQRVEIDLESLQPRGLISPRNPATRVAEEFRLIKRPLLQRALLSGVTGRAAAKGTAITRPNVILVTSSRPREGKTFVAANLAISMAIERDVHVLLIDADVVNPMVFKTLGIEEQPGLTEVLQDPARDVGSVILRTNVEKLSVMSAGSPHVMATELLASDRMTKLVNELATRYPDRVIIFDSPPLLATSEPSVLAHRAGQIVFVVEAERTGEMAVRSALDLIDDCENVFCVLNKTSSLFSQQRFGTYYSKYYKKRK